MRKGYSFDDVLLVPKYGVLNKRKDADISGELVAGLFLSIPIISANMPSVTNAKVAKEMRLCGGIGALHRINKGIIEALEEWDDVGKNPHSAIVSVGLKNGIDRAIQLFARGARLFLLDVAHGHHQQVNKFIKEFRFALPEKDVKLIVGNIATASAIQQLDVFEIDAVKVGIGPGAACTTREVTGFGVPQLTAIQDVRKILDDAKHRWNVDCRLIADGGIKNSGDIVKALAAGADTVMIGRLLAGCEEAPDGLAYYGNASHQVNGHHAPEGSGGLVEPSGTVAEVMESLAWGIRSGVSYGGATNLAELRRNAEFIEVSPLTHIESSVRI